MANAIDVAAYILAKRGEMTAMKLQKLVYYSQAWALVWDEKPLFGEAIEAWANGPVCPALYARHKGQFIVKPGDVGGNGESLVSSEKDTVDRVVAFYGDRSAAWLSDLTHSEPPWKNARGGKAPGERCDAEITHEAMAEYYGSL